jgi:hypothetical protein
VSFVAGVSPGNKQDCLNSTLLASLAASAQYDRETQTVLWYDSYRNVLEQVGWDMQAFSFSEYTTSGSSFTMSEAVLQILAAVLTADELEIATATLGALQSLSQGDGRLTLFNHNAASDSNGNFQINIVSQSPNGAISMTIGAFYFSAAESTTNFLWATYSTSNSSMYTGTQTVTLDLQVYAQVRAAIIAKLGANANSFINNLPPLSTN